MAKGESPVVLRDIHTLFHVGTSNGLTDGQLLERFRARADMKASEAAFAGLMARHGSMVLGVCRRALKDPDDVADAFQATFLVLVRKADTVRVEDSLGRWLYGVSRRVSVRARSAAARRSAREVRGIESTAIPAGDAAMDDLRVILDEEIGRLPEKFRAAVVLCDLDGLGHDEAARQMGCAVGTVKSRLSRAREKLRSRLIRRGVAPSAVALSGETASAAPPDALAEATVQAAMRYAAGHAPVSAAVIDLIQGALRAMFLNKLRMVAFTGISGLALATGAGVVAQQAATPPSRGEPGGARAGQKAEAVKGADNTARRTEPQPDDSSRAEDRPVDEDLELVLDVEFLAKEVEAIKKLISIYSNQIITSQYSADEITGGGEGAFGSEAGFGRARLLDDDEIAATKEKLKELRKTYLLKTKELHQKQKELLAPQRSSRKAETEERQARRVQSVVGAPAPSDAPGISPALEERLSRMEQKLDHFLKAFEDSKRERGR